MLGELRSGYKYFFKGNPIYNITYAFLELYVVTHSTFKANTNIQLYFLSIYLALFICIKYLIYMGFILLLGGQR